MDLSTKYLNIIFKWQKALEALVILAIFFAIGFQFGDDGSQWLWNDYPFVDMLLVFAALLFSLLWIRIEKHKTQTTINGIKDVGKKNVEKNIDKVKLLTGRQKEIFDLILEDKTDKEIMDELFIELSTTKTHINHIYKTLEIVSRKEAKALGNNYKSPNPY